MFYRQITLRRGLAFFVESKRNDPRHSREKPKGEEVEEHASLEDMFESWKK